MNPPQIAAVCLPCGSVVCVPRSDCFIAPPRGDLDFAPARIRVQRVAISKSHHARGGYKLLPEPLRALEIFAVCQGCGQGHCARCKSLAIFGLN